VRGNRGKNGKTTKMPSLIEWRRKQKSGKQTTKQEQREQEQRVGEHRTEKSIEVGGINPTGKKD